MEASCCEYFPEFTRNVRRARRNNPHSSNGVVKQTCRHYLRHIRNAINQKDGNGTKRYVRSELQYHSTKQTRPADLNEALKSPSFKTELPTFPLNEWKEQAYAHIIHERHVYVGHLGECLHFFVKDGVVRHDSIAVLGCNHAETDTRICLHIKAIYDVGNANNIIIRASDTDIAVIMLHHAWKFSATLWMDTDTTNVKNRRYVNLSAIAMRTVLKMCQALHVSHRSYYFSSFLIVIVLVAPLNDQAFTRS